MYHVSRLLVQSNIQKSEGKIRSETCTCSRYIDENNILIPIRLSKLLALIAYAWVDMVFA